MSRIFQADQNDPNENLAHYDELRDSPVAVAVASLCLVLDEGDDPSVSHVLWSSSSSCGTAPSFQHRLRTSCNQSSRLVLQCLIRSGGISSLPGAFPEIKLFMVLPSFSSVVFIFKFFHGWLADAPWQQLLQASHCSE